MTKRGAKGANSQEKDIKARNEEQSRRDIVGRGIEISARNEVQRRRDIVGHRDISQKRRTKPTRHRETQVDNEKI